MSDGAETSDVSDKQNDIAERASGSGSIAVADTHYCYGAYLQRRRFRGCRAKRLYARI